MNAERSTAAELLARRLALHLSPESTIVMAVSSGSVVLAEEVAASLAAPLTVFVNDGRPLPPGPLRPAFAWAEGREVVIVDDALSGIRALRVGSAYVRAADPRSLVVAIPYVDRDAFAQLAEDADLVVAVVVTERPSTARALYGPAEAGAVERVGEGPWPAPETSRIQRVVRRRALFG